MEPQRNEQPSDAAARLHAAFVKERDKFLQNTEKALQMWAGITELRQQFKTERDEAYRELKTSSALREVLSRLMAAVDQSLIGGRLFVVQVAPNPIPPEPAISSTIPSDEVDRFLLALNELDPDGKHEFLDELQSVLQQQDLEQLKRWLRNGNGGRPPKTT